MGGLNVFSLTKKPRALALLWNTTYRFTQLVCVPPLVVNSRCCFWSIRPEVVWLLAHSCPLAPSL